jgi:hypothetical protein
MRQPVTQDRLSRFMRTLGTLATESGRIYLTGGASAVLLDWRSSTIDVDLKFIPESDDLLRRLPALKEQFEINVEFASPDDFIPALPGWQERSVFICEERKLSFFHYDFYAQALAKIERGHTKDVIDVREMLERELVQPSRLLQLFEVIEPQLYRYPAIDPPSFRRAVERVVQAHS